MSCGRVHCDDGTLVYAEVRSKSGEVLRRVPVPRYAESLEEVAEPGPEDSVSTSVQVCEVCDPSYLPPEERERVAVATRQGFVTPPVDDEQEPAKRSLPYREDD